MTAPAEVIENESNGHSRVELRPTATDPLRGLRVLPKLAVIGRERLVELAHEAVVYTWLGIAMAGIIIAIAGAPGEGKTTLLFLVVVARANVGNAVAVLGLPVTPAPTGRYVVLVEAEHGPASAARKLVKSCEALRLDFACLDRVILLARRDVRLGTPAWEEVERMIAAGIVSDVFVDSLARFGRPDSKSNDEDEQALIFSAVANAIESSPAPQPTFWIIAHGRKGSTGTSEDVSGSQQRGAQVDSLLFVRADRDSKTGQVISSKVTFPKLREEPDEWPGVREFSVCRDDQGCWTVIDGKRDDEVDAEPAVDRLARYLAKRGPTSKTVARAELGMNSKTFEGALTQLFQARRIRTSTAKVRGKDVKYFAVYETPSPEPVREEGDDVL